MNSVQAGSDASFLLPGNQVFCDKFEGRRTNLDTLTWKQAYYLTQDILHLLAEHEFLPRLPALRHDIRGTIAEGLKFYSVEVEPPPPKEVAPLGPGPCQLDLMTLECACLCTKHGIRDIHFNEALNNLRAMIRELIGHLGYRFNWEFYDHTVWGDYKEWAELARLSSTPSM